jgi:predicted DCC family thiol-disulfide oxidoreductase YuxK
MIDQMKKLSQTPSAVNYPLTLLYDGTCPVCRMEMNEMARRNGDGKLILVDMSAPGFDLAHYTRVQHTTWEAINAQIHGVRPDGTFVVGVETLRLAYEAVGLGRIWQPTRWPVLNTLADWGYLLFARHRQRISRLLAPLILRIEARRATERMAACKAGVCELKRSL